MLAPLCRFCGKTIKKRTRDVYFNSERFRGGFGVTMVERPVTREDAQKFFNEKIIASKFEDDLEGRCVYRVTLWDGETYINKHFCKNGCAESFGRMMAEYDKTVSTKTYFKKLEEQKEKANAKT